MSRPITSAIFAFVFAAIATASHQPAAQYPVMEAIAQKVLQKYQGSSCEQLWAEKKQPPNPQQAQMKDKALHQLHQDPDMRKAVRIDQGGGLLQKHGVDVNILCTVHAANGDHPHDVYRFFRDQLGAEFLQFIPIVERVSAEMLPLANRGWGERGSDPRPLYVLEGNEVTDRSVRSEQWGRFLIGIFDEWIRTDVGRVFVQMFDAALASWVGPAVTDVHFQQDVRQRHALKPRSTRASPRPRRGHAVGKRCGWGTPGLTGGVIQCRLVAAAARPTVPAVPTGQEDLPAAACRRWR